MVLVHLWVVEYFLLEATRALDVTLRWIPSIKPEVRDQVRTTEQSTNEVLEGKMVNHLDGDCFMRHWVHHMPRRPALRALRSVGVL